LNNDAYIRFLVSAIERLSKPYRGELAKYGIHGENESLRLTQKEKVVTITKKGEEKEVTKTVSNLKKGQTITKLRIKQLVAKSTEIEYDKIIQGRVSDIKPKDYIFIIDKNGKLESGTKIERIKGRVITLSAPLKGGTDSKSPTATALILNPWQTNVVSSSDLATIRGNKSQKYLEQKFSKLQAFYMFMKGGKQRLNQVLKKQIVLTIYGLVSKKGGKLFDPNLTKTVKDKVFAKNAISEYIIPAFIIVGD
jgi:tetrahydromethanopterin S-methyltransferase subunit F